jgi:uncharacterized protein YdiU (UPF0061 family)
MRSKLGLGSGESDDVDLIQSLLTWMQDSRADFTNTFRDLSLESLPEGERYRDPVFQSWYSRWLQRLEREGASNATVGAAMRAVNPAVIPRNLRVEEALTAAEERDDLSVMHQLLNVLSSPFEDRPENAKYREPAPEGCGYRTFCGT